MTTIMNEQLERRISEKLDGRLDDAATTELLRELMRDPKARGTHDAWQRNDRHAAAALRAVVDLPHRPFVIQPRKASTFPWAQLLATAALIVMAFGVWALVSELNGVGLDGEAGRAALPRRAVRIETALIR
jgi:anti-sigma factor RsiW